MLIVEPYKGELTQLCRFKTPDIARNSSAAIFDKFTAYLATGDSFRFAKGDGRSREGGKRSDFRCEVA